MPYYQSAGGVKKTRGSNRSLTVAARIGASRLGLGHRGSDWGIAAPIRAATVRERLLDTLQRYFVVTVVSPEPSVSAVAGVFSRPALPCSPRTIRRARPLNALR